MQPEDAFSIAEADTHIQAGKQAWMRKDYRAAHAAWTEAVSCDPTKKKSLQKWLDQSRDKIVDEHLARGRSLEEQGDGEAAAKEYATCLRLRPGDPEIQAYLQARIKGEEAKQTTREVLLLAGVVVAVLALLGGLAAILLRFV